MRAMDFTGWFSRIGALVLGVVGVYRFCSSWLDILDCATRFGVHDLVRMLISAVGMFILWRSCSAG